MKKVLIITYYWPPSGGAGVQRWMKFAKYLPEFGWEPVIVTPENPSFINKDPSLLTEVSDIEVLKLPIWEPYQLFEKASGKKTHQKNVVLTGKLTLKQKVAIWLRGNLFIPDPRKFWVKRVYQFLKDYLPGTGIETVITTGPPHSLHLIGLKLKKKLNVKWVADFRDPWSEWDVLETFRLSSYAWNRHRKLEARVLNKADMITSVGWTMDQDLKRLGAKRSAVLTNGFDPDDFKGSFHVKSGREEFTIRHVGSIDDQRDPRPFLRMLSALSMKHSRKLNFEFVGNVNPVLVKDVKEDQELNKFISFRDYVPHSEVIDLYRNTDLLLLVLAHSKSAKLNITGKIFEYIASGTPVLGIGDPGGDAARVLEETGRGRVFLPESMDEIETYVEDKLHAVENNEYSLPESPYSRKNITAELAKILNTL